MTEAVSRADRRLELLVQLSLPLVAYQADARLFNESPEKRREVAGYIAERAVELLAALEEVAMANETAPVARSSAHEPQGPSREQSVPASPAEEDGP